jgi:transcription factor Dp-1
MNDSGSIRSPLQDRNKKLINLSRQVLDHVRSTERTTGNQIAKEIIKGFSEDVLEADFKNIQRRVYDALNVLHALSIISKNRNEIKYRGLVDRNDLAFLHNKINDKKKEVDIKRKQLGENLMQFIALHKLIRRNQESGNKDTFVELPCLVISGSSRSDLEFSEDTVLISSTEPLKVLSDCHLLANMNMHRFTAEEISEHFPHEIFTLIGNSYACSDEPSEKDYREIYLKINTNNKTDF